MTTTTKRPVGRPRKPIIKVAPKPAADPTPVAVDPVQMDTGGPRDTPEAKEFRDYAFVQNKPGDVVKDRRPAGTNMFSVSEATRTRLGIKPEEAVGWPVDTNYGNLRNVRPDDNLATLKDGCPEMQVVLDPATKQPVRVGCHVMVKYPARMVEEAQKEIDRQHAENQRNMREHGLPGDREIRSEAEMRQWAQENRELMRGLGIGSEAMSPTAGRSYEEVMRTRTTDEMKAEMERYRMGGRRPNIADAEAATEARDRQARDKSGQKRVWSGWRPG